MKGNKRPVTASLLAAFTALSVLFTSVTDAPTPPEATEPPGPRLMAADRLLNENDEPAEEEPEGEEEEKRGRKGRLAALPLRRRLALLLPLLLVGAALVAAASLLLPGLMAFPAVLAVLVGCFALGGKLLFPEVPLKALFSRRTLTVLVAGAGVVWASGVVLNLFWDGCDLAVGLCEAALLLGALGIGLYCARPKPEPLPPEPEPAPPTSLTFQDGHGEFTLDFRR